MTPSLASPLSLFMSGLLHDHQVTGDFLPMIVDDNARIKPSTRIVTSLPSPESSISNHSNHRWECMEPPPQMSTKLKKNYKKTVASSTATNTTSRSRNRSTTTSGDKITAAGTIAIAPPGRSAPLPSGYPRAQVPMFSSSTMPTCPIRQISKDRGGGEISGQHQHHGRLPMNSNGLVLGSKPSIIPSSRQQYRTQPSSLATSNTTTISQDPAYSSPIRALSPTQKLTRKLSETLARFTGGNLVEESSSPPVRILSRLEGRRLSRTFAIQAMDPPSQPQRKPSAQVDTAPNDLTPVMPQHNASISSISSFASIEESPSSRRPSMTRKQAVNVVESSSSFSSKSSSSTPPKEFVIQADPSNAVMVPRPSSSPSAAFKHRRSTTPPRASRPMTNMFQRMSSRG